MSLWRGMSSFKNHHMQPTGLETASIKAIRDGWRLQNGWLFREFQLAFDPGLSPLIFNCMPFKGPKSAK